jgi:hypothetical protein
VEAKIQKDLSGTEIHLNNESRRSKDDRRFRLEEEEEAKNISARKKVRLKNKT